MIIYSTACTKIPIALRLAVPFCESGIVPFFTVKLNHMTYFGQWEVKRQHASSKQKFKEILHIYPSVLALSLCPRTACPSQCCSFRLNSGTRGQEKPQPILTIHMEHEREKLLLQATYFGVVFSQQNELASKKLTSMITATKKGDAKVTNTLKSVALASWPSGWYRENYY